jgi:hypothetical protein
MVSTPANITADKEREKARAKARKRLHPFMPAAMHKPAIIRWLKHFHAWFGIAGAVAGVIFAWSGFVLNHRTDFKIGGEIVTVESTIPAPDARAFADGDEFGLYVKEQLGLFGQPRAPGMGGAGMGGGAPTAVPGGPVIDTPTRFAASFTAASDAVAATYTAGDEVISIARQERPLQRALNRMHLGQIIMDAFSGALIFLCISGVLIWTRLDGSRLVGAGLIGLSSGLTLFWIFAGA